MLEDALQGALIGAICGLIVWLYNKFKKSGSNSGTGQNSQQNSQEYSVSKQAVSLLAVGGIMHDRQFPLYEKPICIGTDASKCSIVYPAGTPGIAPLHCQILPQNDGWLLVDFSQSGTWLGTERLKGGEPYVIRIGDVFYLASQENSFHFQEMTI